MTRILFLVLALFLPQAAAAQVPSILSELLLPGQTVVDAKGVLVGYIRQEGTVIREIGGTWNEIELSPAGIFDTSGRTQVFHQSTDCSGPGYIITLNALLPQVYFTGNLKGFADGYFASGTLVYVGRPQHMLTMNSLFVIIDGKPTCFTPAVNFQPVTSLFAPAGQTQLSFTPPFSLK
jgi:hypothetical protein